MFTSQLQSCCFEFPATLEPVEKKIKFLTKMSVKFTVEEGKYMKTQLPMPRSKNDSKKKHQEKFSKKMARISKMRQISKHVFPRNDTK